MNFLKLRNMPARWLAAWRRKWEKETEEYPMDFVVGPTTYWWQDDETGEWRDYIEGDEGESKEAWEKHLKYLKKYGKVMDSWRITTGPIDNDKYVIGYNPAEEKEDEQGKSEI